MRALSRVETIGSTGAIGESSAGVSKDVIVDEIVGLEGIFEEVLCRVIEPTS